MGHTTFCWPAASGWWEMWWNNRHLACGTLLTICPKGISTGDRVGMPPSQGAFSVHRQMNEASLAKYPPQSQSAALLGCFLCLCCFAFLKRKTENRSFMDVLLGHHHCVKASQTRNSSNLGAFQAPERDFFLLNRMGNGFLETLPPQTFMPAAS